MLIELLFDLVKSLISFAFSIFPGITDNPLPTGFLGDIALVTSKAYIITSLPILRVLTDVFLWWLPIATVIFSFKIIIFISRFIPSLNLKSNI